MSLEENSSLSTEENRSGAVGTLLRASRNRLGYGLDEISNTLRIRYLYLDAIENCRYEDLPGETYAVGFIRAYSEHLGLDSEDVVLRYKSERATNQNQNELIFPTPVPDSGVPKGAVFLIGLFISVAAYGGWYFTNYDDSSFAQFVSTVPDHLTKLLDDGKSIETKNPEIVVNTTDPIDSNDIVKNTTQQKKTDISSPPEELSNARQGLESAAVSNSGADDRNNRLKDTSTTDTQIIVKKTEPEPDNYSMVDRGSAGETQEIFQETVSVSAPPANKISEKKLAISNQGLKEPNQSNKNVLIPGIENEAKILPQGVNGDARDTAPSSLNEERSSNELTEQSLLLEETSALEVNDNILPVTVNASNTDAPVMQDTIGQVILRAQANCWIQINEGVSGEILLTRLLQKGDEYKIPRKKGLSLSTGNAGALEILVDNVRVAAVGSYGEIKRGISLDPEVLRRGSILQ